MEFSLTKINDQVTLLKPASRINMGNIQFLEQSAQEAVDCGAHYLVIDLSEVESITSAGLRSIHAAHKTFSAVFGEQMSGTQKSAYIKLLSPTPYVQSVLKVSGFIDLFEIYGNLQQAVHSCA